MSLKCIVNGSKTEVNISEQEIRDQVARLLKSAIFVQSDRLSRFLRFTIETTLAGESETLKEYLIGTEVYDRKPPYHPSADSIVRSEARRLRSKLKQYYESEGQDDPVFIYYRCGSYVPVFRLQRSSHRISSESDRALGDLLSEGLAAQDLDFSSTELDVQIIFQGTLRVLRSGVPLSTDARSVANGTKRNQIRKMVSMTLRKSARGCLS